jgi:hypothetical protein
MTQDATRKEYKSLGFFSFFGSGETESTWYVDH